jgi:hypothetical protein
MDERRRLLWENKKDYSLLGATDNPSRVVIYENYYIKCNTMFQNCKYKLKI